MRIISQFDGCFPSFIMIREILNPGGKFEKNKNQLVISPLEHQLDVDVGTDVESFNAILSVVGEAKDSQVQILHKSVSINKL